MRLVEQAPNLAFGNIFKASIAAGFLSLGVIGCGDSDHVVSKSQEISDAPPTVNTEPVAVAQSNAANTERLPYNCRYNLRNRQPSVSISPLHVKVWGNCQSPPDGPASIFPKPLYEHGSGIGRVYNGDVVEIKCKTKVKKKDEVTDHTGSSLSTSRWWVKIEAQRKRGSTTGYMSVVNLGFPLLDHVKKC